MKQLTIRGFDKPLERRLRDVARRQGISLNRAALVFLRRGAGLAADAPADDTVGTSLDWFIGTWSEREEKELLESIRIFEHVDDELWR